MWLLSSLLAVASLSAFFMRTAGPPTRRDRKNQPHKENQVAVQEDPKGPNAPSIIDISSVAFPDDLRVVHPAAIQNGKTMEGMARLLRQNTINEAHRLTIELKKRRLRTEPPQGRDPAEDHRPWVEKRYQRTCQDHQRRRTKHGTRSQTSWAPLPPRVRDHQRTGKKDTSSTRER